MSPTRKECSPIQSYHNVPPVYVRGSHHLADLLSSREGGQPTKIRQAPDNNVIIYQLFQKKEEAKMERQEATTIFWMTWVCQNS